MKGNWWYKNKENKNQTINKYLGINDRETAIENAVTVFNIESDEIKGRIIGREGRNIKVIEQLTGTEIIVDDTPEAVILSAFDQFRREVARLSLEKLISDGRIHPARIEEVVKKRNVLKLQEQRKLLNEGLNEDNILRQFQNKNVLVNKGLAGIQLILKMLKSKQNSLKFDNLYLKVSEKIVTSEFWKNIEEKEKIYPGNLGLLSGLGGVGLTLIDGIY